jgi:DNA replication protein DnaC
MSQNLSHKQCYPRFLAGAPALANCQWTKMYRNVLIVGATGTGKTFLACALAHKACLEGSSVFTKTFTRASFSKRRWLL